MTNTEYFITDINGSSSSSEPANDVYASDDNSVLSVNQSHNVHTPNKIMSLSKIQKNSHNLIEGPNHYMHNFQDTGFLNPLIVILIQVIVDIHLVMA
ncbi:hypothetical protein CEXT_424561 [Caerostris extrusa]|uniref:Uncharacterized protein n=1 Tax=Caerostris extrusa TaxID=172846 RepID=A0AAV4XKH1_CAEEX|nr:hypothetical protein CEXT_424561 [Caerostris extrusa]